MKPMIAEESISAQQTLRLQALLHIGRVIEEAILKMVGPPKSIFVKSHCAHILLRNTNWRHGTHESTCGRFFLCSDTCFIAFKMDFVNLGLMDNYWISITIDNNNITLALNRQECKLIYFSHLVNAKGYVVDRLPIKIIEPRWLLPANWYSSLITQPLFFGSTPRDSDASRNQKRQKQSEITETHM